MYIFYPCNLQPRYYRGYDFDQGGNIDGEQRVVNEMLEDLDGKLVMRKSDFVACKRQLCMRPATANVKHGQHFKFLLSRKYTSS